MAMGGQDFYNNNGNHNQNAVRNNTKTNTN